MMKTSITTPVGTLGNSPKIGTVNSLSQKKGYVNAMMIAIAARAKRPTYGTLSHGGT